MLSMYAKLFSRIAESSLMEQDVTVRYCFMMLLAVSDMHGDVIGTDVAIARRLNLPVEEFSKAITALMTEDPDSNSQDQDGKRVVPSESGRGYHIVNYVKYREIKSDEEKRAYMREYMRRRRKSHSDKCVTDVKNGKDSLGHVTHAEEEAESDTKAEASSPPSPTASESGFEEFWQAYPRRVGRADAVKAWKKHKCASFAPKILTSIRALKISHDWTKDGGQYIPHPATWLNREGWTDEPGNHPGNGGLDKSKTLGLRPGEGIPMYDPMTDQTTFLEPR